MTALHIADLPEGRVDPVPFYVKNDLTGLGKTNQDVRMSMYIIYSPAHTCVYSCTVETTVAQRRELDSERQTKETEEQRRAREVCDLLGHPMAALKAFVGCSRTQLPSAQLSSQKSPPRSAHSIATSATSSSKMSRSTTSTPTPMPTTTKRASATCSSPRARTETPRKKWTKGRRRRESGKRRSCASWRRLLVSRSRSPQSPSLRPRRHQAPLLDPVRRTKSAASGSLVGQP